MKCKELLRDLPSWQTRGQHRSYRSSEIFNPTGAGTWYATEYDPESKEFFRYVSIFGDWNVNGVRSRSMNSKAILANLAPRFVFQ